MKRCTKCGEVKPLNQFHRQAARADGHQSQCKPCALARVSAWQALHPARHAATNATWRKQNAARAQSQKQAYRIAYPEKRRAQSLLYGAVARGAIIKPQACMECGTLTLKQNLAGHHFLGYQKPFAVIWLCDPCHKRAHRKLKEA